MRLSTKGRYGTRSMLELACQANKGPVLAKDIANKQNIPPKYLEHIFSVLKASGLINSQRGSKGGYELARHPKDIRILDIIRSLEGSVSPVECVDDRYKCKKSGTCVTRELWQKVKTAVEEILSTVTLEDLLKKETRNRKTSKSMYYI